MDQPTDQASKLLPELLNAKQVAGMLNVSQRTLYRLKDGNQLPKEVELGSSVRWRRREVIQWIDQGCPPRIFENVSEAENE